MPIACVARAFFKVKGEILRMCVHGRRKDEVKKSWGVLPGILGGAVPPGFPNPDPISDQNMSFSTPVFGPAARFSKVPIINGPGKLSLITLKIQVSIVLHLA